MLGTHSSVRRALDASPAAVTVDGPRRLCYTVPIPTNGSQLAFGARQLLDGLGWGVGWTCLELGFLAFGFQWAQPLILNHLYVVSINQQAGAVGRFSRVVACSEGASSATRFSIIGYESQLNQHPSSAASQPASQQASNMRPLSDDETKKVFERLAK